MTYLTRTQRLLLEASSLNPRTGAGYPRELTGAGQWAAARVLVERGIGTIHRGYFFASPAGFAAVLDDRQAAA